MAQDFIPEGEESAYSEGTYRDFVPSEEPKQVVVPSEETEQIEETAQEEAPKRRGRKPSKK